MRNFTNIYISGHLDQQQQYTTDLDITAKSWNRNMAISILSCQCIKAMSCIPGLDHVCDLFDFAYAFGVCVGVCVCALKCTIHADHWCACLWVYVAHKCIHAQMCVSGHVCVHMHVCALAGMSADVLSNPAVGLLWISRRLQGMGIPFLFTALPGSKKGKDAFSLLPSHQLEPEGVCVCFVEMMCMCGLQNLYLMVNSAFSQSLILIMV